MKEIIKGLPHVRPALVMILFHSVDYGLDVDWISKGQQVKVGTF